MKKSFVAIFACPLILNVACSLSISSVNEHFSDHLPRENSDENGNLNLRQNSLPHRIKRWYNNNLSNESDSAMQPGEMHRDSSVYLDFTNHNVHLEGDSSLNAATVGKGRNNFHRSHKSTPPSTEKKAVDDSTPHRSKTRGKYKTWITKSEEQQKSRSVRSKNDVKRNRTERGLSRKGATHSKHQLINFENDVVESGDEDNGLPNTDGDIGDDSVDNLLNSKEDNLMNDFADNLLSENDSDRLVDAVEGDLSDGSVNSLFIDDGDSLMNTDDDLGDSSADNLFSDNGDSLMNTDDDLGDSSAGNLFSDDGDSLMDPTQDDLGDDPIDHLFTDDIDIDRGDDLFRIGGGNLRGDNLFNDGHDQSDNSRDASLGKTAVDSLTDEENVLGTIWDDLPLDDPLDNVRSTYNSGSSSLPTYGKNNSISNGLLNTAPHVREYNKLDGKSYVDVSEATNYSNHKGDSSVNSKNDVFIDNPGLSDKMGGNAKSDDRGDFRARSKSEVVMKKSPISGSKKGDQEKTNKDNMLNSNQKSGSAAAMDSTGGDNFSGASIGSNEGDVLGKPDAKKSANSGQADSNGELSLKSRANPAERSGQKPPQSSNKGSIEGALSKNDEEKPQSSNKGSIEGALSKSGEEKPKDSKKGSVEGALSKSDGDKPKDSKKGSIEGALSKNDEEKPKDSNKGSIKGALSKNDEEKPKDSNKASVKGTLDKRDKNDRKEKNTAYKNPNNSQSGTNGTLNSNLKNDAKERPRVEKESTPQEKVTTISKGSRRGTSKSTERNHSEEKVDTKGTPTSAGSTSSNISSNSTSSISNNNNNNSNSNSGGAQMDKGKKTDAEGMAIPSNANDSKGTENNTVKSKDDPKGEGNSTPPVERSGTSRSINTEGPHIEERSPLDSVNKRGNQGEENVKEKNNSADASSAVRDSGSAFSSDDGNHFSEEPPKEHRALPNPIGETINIKIISNPNYEVNQKEGKEMKKRDTHPKGRGKKNRPSSKRRNGKSYKVDRGETRRDDLSSSENLGNAEWSEDSLEGRSGVDPNADVHVRSSAEQGDKPSSPEGDTHSRSKSPSELSVSIELPHGLSEVKEAEAVMIPEGESAEEEKELSLLQMSAEKGDRADEANEYADEGNDNTDEASDDPQDELILEKVREDKNLERFGEEETVENIASIEHPLIRRKKNIVKNSRKVYDLNLYNCTFIEDWDLNHEYMDEEGSLVKLSGYVFQNMVNSDLMPTANITDWKLKGSCDYDKYVCGALGYMNNVYSKGERVIFEGRVYEATSDAYGTPREMENVWVEKTDDCYDF